MRRLQTSHESKPLDSNIGVVKSSTKKQADPKSLVFYEVIGAGSFGKVYRAFDHSVDRIVAVKILELDSHSSVDELILELKFLSDLLKSEHVTRYFNATLYDSLLLVSMEYCAAGSCMSMLQRFKYFSESAAAYVIKESLKGLEFIHAQQKIHRDLKSANILITGNYEVKIADFGVSAQLSRTFPERYSFMGTPYWMAPEVIRSETHYNTAADIWSMGIVIFELVCGHPPYRKLKPHEAMMKIANESPAALPAYGREDNKFTQTLISIVAACLMRNPSKRPTATMLLKTNYFRRIRSVPTEFRQMVDTVMTAREAKSRKAIPCSIGEICDVLKCEDSDSTPPLICKDSDSKMDDNESDWDFEDEPPAGAPPGISTLLACGPAACRKHPLRNQRHGVLGSSRKLRTPHNSPGSHGKHKAVDLEVASICMRLLATALARVGTRCSIPSIISKLEVLQETFDEYEKTYPGFSRTFLEEVWRVIADSERRGLDKTKRKTKRPERSA